MQVRLNMSETEHSLIEVALTLKGRPKSDLPRFVVQAAVNEAAAVVARKASKASE